MSQCWNSFPVALYFPLSHGGLKRAFDRKITQLRESGTLNSFDSVIISAIVAALAHAAVTAVFGKLD